jgi:iron(III) transport system ATP-binding protein
MNPPRDPAAAGLSVETLTKSFGTQSVLRGVDLDVRSGELMAVLGPSGCGKTTLLRLVAGFDTPDSGVITIGERTLNDRRRRIAPERRNIGYVAQEGALFPHLSVRRNISYGLRRAQRRDGRRIGQLLELVGLPRSCAGRYPHQLSGGQQQRVALARALAPDPAVVLLDEPFSSLDAGLRTETGEAVATALADSGATAVLVTHDQAEALSLADRVAVMRDGVLVQVAAPDDLYGRPADLQVARFVGDAVVVPGTVSGAVAECEFGRLPVRIVPDSPTGGAGAARLMIRPEQILLEPPETNEQARARVQRCVYYGHDATVRVQLAGSGTEVTARCAGQTLPVPGDDVAVRVIDTVLAYPAAGPEPLAANAVNVEVS